jgi:glyoxylase-like metal-dependent hydrolase (beta-lactamase superfamily II)
MNKYLMSNLPIGVTFFERGWLSSNSVLIQDATHAILVDTGYWTHALQTEALLLQALGSRQLTSILNTHLHSDHCGGNAHLQSIFPELQTYIPPGHAPYVDAWDPKVLTYTPTGQDCPQFKKSGVLHHGDSFVVANKTWRIHAAPGHDPHSVVIYNEDDGVLISADALWENGFGVVFPEIEGTSAFDEVESTLQIIEQLKPKLVLPGHGAPFKDVTEALIRARSRLAQFKNAPEKHASYAAKVLLKFKLLELQKSKLSDYEAWAEAADYLQLLHATYANEMSFHAWFMDLCKSLEKAGACTVTKDEIINI